MRTYFLTTEYRDEDKRTYLNLFSSVDEGTTKVLESQCYTSESNTAYTDRVERFKLLVKKFNSNHYDRVLIVNYLEVLKCGFETGFIWNRFGISFDTLDLVNNKLKRSSNILGGLLDNRTQSVSGFPSDKYTQHTHTKGKFAGHTKCYLPTSMIHQSGTYIYQGTSRYSIAEESSYISLFDLENCKRDQLSNKNRWILAGSKGFNATFNKQSYFDIAKRTISEFELNKCSKCQIWTDSIDHQNVCEICRSEGVSYQVNDYGHKPSPKFIRLVNGNLKAYSYSDARFDKYMYGGGELEVELKNGTSYEYKKIIADEIMRIKTSNGVPIFYCKTDGSLESGFEIVSHPLTFNAWRHFDFEGLIYRYRSYIKSFNTNTAGMHLHVSRNAFTDYEAIKVLKMTYNFPKFSMLISERNVESQNAWASLRRSQIKAISKIAVSTAKEGYNPTGYNFDCPKTMRKVSKAVGGHRGAWNFQNENTAECRLFKGQLRPVHFYKNLEYVEALIDFVKNTSMENLEIGRFVGFIKSNFQAYPNLNRFLNKNKSRLQNAIVNPREVPEGLRV